MSVIQHFNYQVPPHIRNKYPKEAREYEKWLIRAKEICSTLTLHYRAHESVDRPEQFSGMSGTLLSLVASGNPIVNLEKVELKGEHSCRLRRIYDLYFSIYIPIDYDGKISLVSKFKVKNGEYCYTTPLYSGKDNEKEIGECLAECRNYSYPFPEYNESTQSYLQLLRNYGQQIEHSFGETEWINGEEYKRVQICSPFFPIVSLSGNETLLTFLAEYALDHFYLECGTLDQEERVEICHKQTQHYLLFPTELMTIESGVLIDLESRWQNYV